MKEKENKNCPCPKHLITVYVCKMDVVTSFLMLASDAMMAVEENEEDSKARLSSW